MPPATRRTTYHLIHFTAMQSMIIRRARSSKWCATCHQTHHLPSTNWFTLQQGIKVIRRARFTNYNITNALIIPRCIIVMMLDYNFATGQIDFLLPTLTLIAVGYLIFSKISNILHSENMHITRFSVVVFLEPCFNAHYTNHTFFMCLFLSSLKKRM